MVVILRLVLVLQLRCLGGGAAGKLRQILGLEIKMFSQSKLIFNDSEN